MNYFLPTNRIGRDTSLVVLTLTLLSTWLLASSTKADEDDCLVLEPAQSNGKHIVLIAGDEEYRSEESAPMLAKILSSRHGFKCTVLFSFGPEGAKYIDANNQQGLRKLESLNTADLMIIGTRFRQPSADEAQHITNYLNAGKPVIGFRTATHAFRGNGKFGDTLAYGQFGRLILGEQWVNHHGDHKRQGALATVEPSQTDHPIMRSVPQLFAPSDVYGVKHLTDKDTILMRAAVTESLDPKSKPIDGPKNDPRQAIAWLHSYTSPDGKQQGNSFCTTAGASLDFVDENLRRLIVNASYHLTGLEVPQKADVQYVDPFYPSFYGFVPDKDYWKNQNLQPADFGLGKSPALSDPPGSPKWPFRPRSKK